MNKQATTVTIIFAVMLLAAGVFLVRIQSAYKLGNPAVVVVNEPLYDENTNLVANIAVGVPKELPGYKSFPAPVTSIELNMLPPDTVYGRRFYKADDGWETFLSVVLMGADRTSIHKPQYCLIGQGWQLEGAEPIEIPIWEPEFRKIKAMKLSCSRTERTSDGRPVQVRGLFVYWFVADGQSTPFHGERMWLLARDLVTSGVLQRWAYIASLGRCLPGQEEALLKRMKGFIAQAYPKFEAENQSKALASAAKTANNSSH